MSDHNAPTAQIIDGSHNAGNIFDGSIGTLTTSGGGGTTGQAMGAGTFAFITYPS